MLVLAVVALVGQTDLLWEVMLAPELALIGSFRFSLIGWMTLTMSQVRNRLMMEG